jgi:hypothetical protein
MRTTRERPRAVGTDLGRRAAQAVRRPDITLLLLHRNVRCVCCLWPVESPVAQELARPAARTAESSSRRVSVRGARLCCDIQVAPSRKTLSTLLGCDMRRRARELAAHVRAMCQRGGRDVFRSAPSLGYPHMHVGAPRTRQLHARDIRGQLRFVCRHTSRSRSRSRPCSRSRSRPCSRSRSRSRPRPRSRSRSRSRRSSPRERGRRASACSGCIEHEW